MAPQDQELEVKFYLADQQGLARRLETLGAQLQQARTYENNLRFDTPEESLARKQHVLRLRQDAAARLTFKGPSEIREGVWARQELEFSVGDFAAARALLEALGYQVSMTYEKYRTSYRMGEVEVTLDEMPYGDFAELEGPGGAAIRAAADRLGLDWEARLLTSYMALFERARSNLGFAFRDLTFENFQGLQVAPGAMAARPADWPEN
jgi:adenylate cyclase class 2